MFRSKWVLALVLPILFTGLTACNDDDDDDGVGVNGPHDLTFAGDATFQGPHANQEVHVIVLDATGEPVAQDVSVVSADSDPAFSFTFSDILEEGEDYMIHYWIDSNFGEAGTPGACDDDLEVDHQWEIQITDVDGDVALTEEHDAGALTPICDSFAFDFAFNGDASFQDEHAGQDVTYALVRTTGGQDLVVTTETATVSGTEDPSFSFEAPGTLVRNAEYRVDYFIDEDASGTCTEIDPQWTLEVDEPVDADVVLEDEFRPDEVEAVCATFEEDDETGDGDGNGDGDGDGDGA